MAGRGTAFAALRRAGAVFDMRQAQALGRGYRLPGARGVRGFSQPAGAARQDRPRGDPDFCAGLSAGSGEVGGWGGRAETDLAVIAPLPGAPQAQWATGRPATRISVCPKSLPLNSSGKWCWRASAVTAPIMRFGAATKAAANTAASASLSKMAISAEVSMTIVTETIQLRRSPGFRSRCACPGREGWRNVRR